MKITEIKIGPKVKYQNHKWIGTVQDIKEKFDEVVVIFEGDGALEFIDVDVSLRRPAAAESCGYPG
ncbi:hypothetical protein ACSAZL_01185 [Methanosarcina sp. T3]|uniref:hypothetical protein n=1 Tax=Methanosarcina sp. T3 TaxID=3439062 RepID=UPI003F8757C4